MLARSKSLYSSIIHQTFLSQSRQPTNLWKAAVSTARSANYLGQRWTQQHDDLVILRRRQGVSFKTIGAELARSKASVVSRYHRTLSKHDTLARDKLSPEDKVKLETIESRVQEGKLLFQIADELGMEVRQLEYFYHKYNPELFASNLWSQSEIHDAVRLASDGLGAHAIGTVLGRSQSATQNLLSRLRTGKLALPPGVTTMPPGRHQSDSGKTRERRPTGTRWSTTRTERLATLYRNGVPFEQLAAEFKVSRAAIDAAIFKIRISQGVPFRSGGWTSEEDERIRQLRVVDGLSWKDVTAHLNTGDRKRSVTAVTKRWQKICKTEKLAGNKSIANDARDGKETLVATATVGNTANGKKE